MILRAGHLAAKNTRQLQELTAEKNRATQENYAPGSIFKVVVGLAALEAGLNPDRNIHGGAGPARSGPRLHLYWRAEEERPGAAGPV